jgi:hypothetical protein
VPTIASKCARASLETSGQTKVSARSAMERAKNGTRMVEMERLLQSIFLQELRPSSSTIGKEASSASFKYGTTTGKNLMTKPFVFPIPCSGAWVQYQLILISLVSAEGYTIDA